MANIFTNSGRAIATNLVSGLGGTIPHWLGWGVGTAAAAAADTALQSASAEARAVGTVSRTTVTVVNDTVSVVGTLTAASAQAITELGQFDALTGGNLFIHSVFAAINVAVNDTVQFTQTWTLL